MEEQQLTFHNGKGEEQQKMTANIVFEMMDFDGEQYDLTATFSCGEDLENIIDLYTQKNWEELFAYASRSYKHGDVVDSQIFGITFNASNTNGHLYLEATNRNFPNATVSLNLDVMADKNAKKIDEIRKLISN